MMMALYPTGSSSSSLQSHDSDDESEVDLYAVIEGRARIKKTSRDSSPSMMVVVQHNVPRTEHYKITPRRSSNTKDISIKKSMDLLQLPNTITIVPLSDGPASRGTKHDQRKIASLSPPPSRNRKSILSEAPKPRMESMSPPSRGRKSLERYSHPSRRRSVQSVPDEEEILHFSSSELTLTDYNNTAMQKHSSTRKVVDRHSHSSRVRPVQSMPDEDDRRDLSCSDLPTDFDNTIKNQSRLAAQACTTTTLALIPYSSNRKLVDRHTNSSRARSVQSAPDECERLHLSCSDLPLSDLPKSHPRQTTQANPTTTLERVSSSGRKSSSRQSHTSRARSNQSMSDEDEILHFSCSDLLHLPESPKDQLAIPLDRATSSSSNKAMSRLSPLPRVILVQSVPDEVERLDSSSSDTLQSDSTTSAKNQLTAQASTLTKFERVSSSSRKVLDRHSHPSKSRSTVSDDLDRLHSSCSDLPLSNPSTTTTKNQPKLAASSVPPIEHSSMVVRKSVSLSPKPQGTKTILPTHSYQKESWSRRQAMADILRNKSEEDSFLSFPHLQESSMSMSQSYVRMVDRCPPSMERTCKDIQANGTVPKQSFSDKLLGRVAVKQRSSKSNERRKADKEKEYIDTLFPSS